MRIEVPKDITLADLVFMLGQYGGHLESSEGKHFIVVEN